MMEFFLFNYEDNHQDINGLLSDHLHKTRIASEQLIKLLQHKLNAKNKQLLEDNANLLEEELVFLSSRDYKFQNQNYLFVLRDLLVDVAAKEDFLTELEFCLESFLTRV